MQGGHRHPKIFIGNSNSYLIRRITPLECERLQTLEDDYTNLMTILTDLIIWQKKKKLKNLLNIK